MTKQDKNDYWKCVVECLVVYHGWTRRKAAGTVGWLRPRADPLKRGIAICYHLDPFQTAEDMAGERMENITSEEKNGFYNGVLGKKVPI